MNTNTRLSIGIAAAFVVVAGILLTVNATRDDTSSGTTAAAQTDRHERLVRPDSHKLDVAADGKATFVEFLDFECESCRAAFPVVEDLRKEYAGKVTFVVRYFPLPGHFNGERAARAVEAAAAQGKFEQMYQKMYETQAEWGEQQVPADARFRDFAKSLGLDLAAWDKAYADPATLERIKRDVADGEALGVTGTPTFYLNGAKLEPKSVEDLKASLNAALK
ncbi:thioredoxin domain-containing protein [Kribbella sandramycini]|uniref:Protein-disulfide isomerase n=1 Tax=Kribbella sandramycini TaxID=60450 RepID=A0A7Y4KWZ5_9ACTN|nr:thioredoxin domain-containing protein [Kribbella sandramycini]MBB6569962.1 protein-disulfide isomerase [Kribbella sandramycini]NOL40214.1 thioredoxin domain-containing protein [Kribbella sandramycini]